MRDFLRYVKFRLECLCSPRLRRIYANDPTRMLLDQFKGQVADGPFSGMRYIRSACGSALTPKILGTYELELHDVLESLRERQYANVLDVGCAEGYYAVGLSLLLGPEVRIHAYDTNPRARSLLRHLAVTNQVQDLISISDNCSRDDLQRFEGTNTLVFCDIEGAELNLLDPQSAPALLGYDIIVEVHDQPGEQTTRNELQRRFLETHHIRTIPARKRPPYTHRRLWLSNPPLLRNIVDEGRHLGNHWLFMTRRSDYGLTQLAELK